MPVLNEAGTAAVEPVTITEVDMIAAHAWAIEHVAIQARRGGSDLADALHDAATDALLWARDNFDPTKGTFGAFAGSVIRRAVRYAICAHRERSKLRPASVELTATVPANARQSGPAALLIEDLPEDLAFAVRLYMVDGFQIRDCALLMGIGPNVVHRMLRKAAELLAPGRMRPVRPAGERRLGRTDFDRDRG